MSGDRPSGIETQRLANSLAAKMFGEPDTPTRIGRFEVLDLLGQGAMGAVYRARDPELDREVALKVLRTKLGDTSDTDGTALLKAEARALAQLNHPNVVGVLDVGLHRGQVFIAMEFIRGQTLLQWSDAVSLQAPDRIERVVALAKDAAAGLAAAHAVDLVHRDVKPQNMLIGEDGRLRIADFGLALETLEPSLPSGEASKDSRRDVAGTPAYMSPEQLDGRPDARSDQFSLCVSLWEAAFGERPFAGGTVTQTLLEIENGRVRSPRLTSPDARWLASLLRPGLAARPEDRYPSLTALAATLDQGPPSSRNPWLLRGTVAAALGATAVVFALVPSDPPDSCADASVPARAVWTEQRRASLAPAPSLARAIDAYVLAWEQTRRDACLAGQDGAPEALDATMQCLDHRLRRVDAFLSTARDYDVSERALDLTEVVESWARPASCLDSRSLVAFDLPDDPNLVEQIGMLERALIEDTARETLDPQSVTLPRAEELVGRARSLGHEPLLVLALSHLGERLAFAEDTSAAAPFEEAYQIALRIGMDRSAVAAATSAATVYVRFARRHEDAERMLRAAEALVPRVPEPDRPRAKVNIVYVRAESLAAQGRFAEAVALLEAELTSTSNPLDQARLSEKLGFQLSRLGRFDDSIAALERTLAIYRDQLGPEHHQVGVVLTNLGNTHRLRGDGASAVAAFEEARPIAGKMLGEDSPGYAMVDANLASAYLLLGDRARAEAAHRRALEVFDATLPDAHPARVLARINVAGFLDPAEAEPMLNDALTLAEQHAGADSVEATSARSALGSLYARTGRPRRALPMLRRALEHHQSFGRTEHVIRDHAGLARAFDALERREDAIASADEALREAESQYDLDAPYLAVPLTAAAYAYRTQPARARAFIERALALPNAESLAHDAIADARALLAELDE